MPSIKPWYDIVIPHEDIRQGRLSEAVFAANLWAVVQKSAPEMYGKSDLEVPEVYVDPEAFFSKTYLTVGLSNVLQKVARALSEGGEGGERIISLQTSFGGGKTHSLVALWHLARHTDVIKDSAACADVRKALGKTLPKRVKGIAVFTNQTCDPVQGRQSPLGIRTRTLWGELALQLGGKELYQEIEANDQSQAAPKGVYAKILQHAAPCLILLDELADYCVGASAVKVVDSNLADQTISFIQELTEAASQVSGVAIIATLPASFMEVASSERGQEILGSLERRFGRMSSDLRPVADDEIYEVVRRRLFESLGEVAEQKKVIDAYLKMYAQHPNEVPNEAGKGTYRDRMLQSYPFHPTLIDAFYLRWGSHNQFQRTRGVLRLLASIVGDLWQRRNTETQSQGLIQAAHIHWSIDALHSALTRLWGAGFETVIAADVFGEKANAPLLDEERGDDYQREKIAQGLAATILLGSFGGQGERAGFSTKDLKIAVGRPEYNWGYIDGAVLELENRAFYMRFPSAGNLGKRYWFDTKPTLTNLLVRYRQQFSTQNFDSDILSTMEQQARAISSTNWRILVDPANDLPEQKSLSLLILAPNCAYTDPSNQPNLVPSIAEQCVLSLSKKCGTRERLYRNTLLFLLPSNRGLMRLHNAFAEVAALETVKKDYGAQLDSEQSSELTQRLDKARKAVTEALGAAYPYIARLESDRVVPLAISDVRPTLSDHLQSAWRQIVDEEEWVLNKVGIVTLQNVGLVPKDNGIRVKDAIEAFLRYTDKPMIASRDAVLEGLRQACGERIIGIGRGASLNTLQRKWCGDTSVPLDPNEEGLWIIPPFEPEAEVAVKPVDTTPSVSTASSTQAPSTVDTTKRSTGKLTQPASNPIRRLRIKGIVDLSNWADIFRSFVSPAARMNLKRLRLGIDFELEPPDDKPLDANDPAVKAMKESARQLGVDVEEE
jgi:hypothetical protein